MSLASGGTLETILLVEDHAALLRFVKHVLEGAGFTVIAASNARDALHLEADFPGTIDLLLSDVRLKGVSGPALAEKLKERRPHLRVMLMSGYPDGALLVLNYGWHYIEKPFVGAQLVEKINAILHGERREHAVSRFNGLKASRRPVGRMPIPFGRVHHQAS